jgi:hypothetical protein
VVAAGVSAFKAVVSTARVLVDDLVDAVLDRVVLLAVERPMVLLVMLLRDSG